MIKLLVGLLTPKRISGKIYLKKRLKSLGAQPENIPEASLDKIVEVSIFSSKFNSDPHKGKNQVFVETLEMYASIVVRWITDASSEEINEAPLSWLKELLENSVVRKGKNV